MVLYQDFDENIHQRRGWVIQVARDSNNKARGKRRYETLMYTHKEEIYLENLRKVVDVCDQLASKYQVTLSYPKKSAKKLTAE